MIKEAYVYYATIFTFYRVAMKIDIPSIIVTTKMKKLRIANLTLF